MDKAALVNAEVAPAKTLRELGIENYEMIEVHRSQLIGAPYNPRRISDNERAKLKAAIKRHGLVAPITWNARTSHIVGGHQRIEIADALANTSDYRLQVARIDVAESREKELNVLLNNDHAMGEFDFEKLKDIFKDENVTVVGAGFSQSDFVQLFGESAITDRSADLEEFSATLSKIASQYDAIAAKNRKKGASEHYLVFVFPSGEHANKFLTDHGFEDNRYQNGLVLMEKLNGPHRTPATPAD